MFSGWKRKLAALLISLSVIAPAYAQYGTSLLTNKTGSTVSRYDVVINDTSNSNAFKTTTTSRDPKVIGVVDSSTIANNATGRLIQPGGIVKVRVTGLVTRGDYVVTSTTAGAGASGGTTNPAGAFGIALETGTSTNIYVYLISPSQLSGSLDGTFNDIAVNGGDITSSSSSFNFATSSTAINFGAASGTFTFGQNTGTIAVVLNGAAGGTRDLRFQSGGSNRWVLRTEGTAESGSNAGSAFQILARDDSGNAIDNVLTIDRPSGGNMTISRPLVGAATQSVFNTVSTTVNAFGAGTAITMGAASGGMVIRNPNVDVGDSTTTSQHRALNIVSNSNGFFSQLCFREASTLKWRIYHSFGTDTLVFYSDTNTNPELTLTTTGATVRQDIAVNGGDITSTASSFNLLASPTTITFGAASTNTTIGASTGTTTVAADLAVTGVTAGGGITLGATAATVNKYLVINSRAASETGIALQSAGTTKWYIYRPVSGDSLIFNNGSTDKLTLTNAGNLTAAGRIVSNVTPTFTANDTSPDVSTGNTFIIPGTWTAGNNITTLDGGATGEVVTLIGGDSDCVVVDGSNMKMNGNWTAAADATLTLVFNGTNWLEIARSAN